MDRHWKTKPKPFEVNSYQLPDFWQVADLSWILLCVDFIIVELTDAAAARSLMLHNFHQIGHDTPYMVLPALAHTSSILSLVLLLVNRLGIILLIHKYRNFL